MEVDDFMLGFDAERAGLIEVIRSSLFHGAEEEKFVKAELYKLNVYGAPRITANQSLARANMPQLTTYLTPSPRQRCVL